jgi:predicted metalloprotease with PDZ domain
MLSYLSVREFSAQRRPAARRYGLLKSSLRPLAAIGFFALSAITRAQTSSKPFALPLPPALPAPRDRPFLGTVQLEVDATDVVHGIFGVTETFPIARSGKWVLFYPEWDTGSHAPTASAVELAGLRMQVDGRTLAWRRDTANVHAFHILLPARARSLKITFEYLSPRGSAELRPEMVKIPWQRLLLYPAGWYVRDIPFAATLHLPPGLQAFSALTPLHTALLPSNEITFATETLERLVDAPVYAGRYTRRLPLATPTGRQVFLDLLADAPASLSVPDEEIAHIQALLEQTARVFGPAPFMHYDAIISLSNELSPGGGIEHLDEGENNLPADFFIKRAHELNNQDLMPHEYIHAWNGRFKQPSALWSPDFNRPTDPSLLWVYEGQTEFWGRVLAARSGLRTMQETLDKLALDSAAVAERPGRSWKNLQDSDLDPIYMPGHAVAWRDWQRREDYYPEGVLLWLDVDSRLRSLSHNKIGLDDFARRFFDTHGSVETTSTYDFQDVCNTLNNLVPSDWTNFLKKHLLTHDSVDAMAGLARAGWQLIYTDTPTEMFLQEESEAQVTNLDSSLGAQIRLDGSVRSVVWGGPAFQAGLAPGMQIVAVGGRPFTPEILTSAVAAAKNVPIQMTLQDRDKRRDLIVPYSGSLRYPRLQRISGATDTLTLLLTAR